MTIFFLEFTQTLWPIYASSYRVIVSGIDQSCVRRPAVTGAIADFLYLDRQQISVNFSENIAKKNAFENVICGM